jgi:YihY family inner membrane protein
MNPVERVARAVDRFQQEHRTTAFLYAVIKKFGDDDSGRLAAQIAYYGFFSLFPLLLVFVSVLGFVLAGHPQLRDTLVNSALGEFPVIGHSLASNAHLHGLRGSWPSIIIGGIGALWAGLGVAQNAQAAMNTVWDIPRSEWPNFVFRRVRALAMLVLFGTLSIASTFVSGYGISGVAHGAWWTLAAFVVALGLNYVLFALSYRVLTARELHGRDVAPGAAVAAVAWTLLQSVGGYYVTHELRSANDVYGTFALVIALLIWLSLGAQLLLFCAEINVVRLRALWPRSLVQPPLNDGDQRVYQGLVERARMRPEVAVRVWYTRNHDKRRGGRSGSDAPTTTDGTEERAPRPE